MPGLTIDQIALLQKPFQPNEHGWVNGSIYIKKAAIRRRLNQVDPAWMISPPALVIAQDDLIVLTGTLTIGGVARSGLGTGIIQLTKKLSSGSVVDLEGFELSRARAKAYKTAASDILPRAASMFGVGDYLKEIPAGVKDEQKLAAYFQSINRAAPRGGNGAK